MSPSDFKLCGGERIPLDAILKATQDYSMAPTRSYRLIYLLETYCGIVSSAEAIVTALRSSSHRGWASQGLVGMNSDGEKLVSFRC
mmetsp:Transcript_74881/g.124870  ORF Transcript_74881/g.124870 Transcript_74881/m.124870 type:complete len:86 (-) Transcript_74881:196-453(-)